MHAKETHLMEPKAHSSLYTALNTLLGMIVNKVMGKRVLTLCSQNVKGSGLLVMMLCFLVNMIRRDLQFLDYLDVQILAASFPPIFLSIYQICL
jgi:hypothetical protein